jgi:predicted alpha/beta-fold hydrolase
MFAGFLYNIQDKLLYYPDQPPTARLFVDSPSILGLNFENHFVKTSDGVRINLVFVKAPVMSKAPTVIYFHGNAGNIGHRWVLNICHQN